ncbi:MAG: glutathione peroxidase [Burkholderiales bacterium]
MRRSLGIVLFALVSTPAFPACPPLLDHTLPSLADKATPLCQFEGKVVLVVNTASHCGYTPQYEGLEALYRRFREKGLVVLGFPANDFGRQEPGSNKEIATFCEVNYGVSFPMFAKTGVSANNANPFYASLAAKTGERPAWNFHKYLIDRSGEKVLSFDSRVAPEDAPLVGAIERMLAAPERRR